MQKLFSIYQEKFKILDEHLYQYNLNVLNPENKATNPFCITIPEDYETYTNKIMIFGQETNKWCRECGDGGVYSNSLEESLDIYKKFYLSGDFFRYRGPFSNEFKRIRREITKSKNAVFLWNNINKIGRMGKGNIHEINQIQFEYFQPIRDEIQLLKPNILVFLTGPNYDFFIENNIGKFRQTLISDSIWQMHFEDENLKSITSLKTYHPNALYLQGKNKIVIPNLINEIKSNCI